MSLQKSHRIALATAFAAVLAGGLAFAPAASANNVGWSVSIGGPGFAVSAGQPAYWGGYRGSYWGGYRGSYGYGYGHGHRYYRPYRPAVVYPAPVYVAPRPVYVAPRPVYVAPPAYYGYGY